MAYDGFYSDLSSRGSVNEVLNLANAKKEEIEAIAQEVDADAAAAEQSKNQAAAVVGEVNAKAVQVDAQALEVQNNANVVAQFVAQSILSDAPKDGLSYTRLNGAWVTGTAVADFFNASMYFDTVTYGPGNVLAKIYPRMSLSRPILPSCYVRRDVATAQNLTLKLQHTDPANPWEAVCVIPAGQQEGYFMAATVQPLDAAFGVQLVADPVPATPPQGLTVSLQWEVAPDASITSLK